MTPASVPQIFDRRQYAAKMERARHRLRTLGGASYLGDTMADDIAERLAFMQFEAQRALVIGDVTGKLLRPLHDAGTDCKQGRLGQFDEESPGPPQAFDLVVHLMGLAMVNDLPGALIHGRNAVAEGGHFFAAFPAAGSLPALRQIALAADGDRPAARLHPMVDLRGATGLMERAGFRRQVVDSYPIRVRYPSFVRLISDLRDHGITRALTSPAPPLTREWLARAEAAFDTLREGEDRKVTETFEILVLTGWR